MKETRVFKKEISEIALRQKEKHFEGTLRIATLDPTYCRFMGMKQKILSWEIWGTAHTELPLGAFPKG